MRRDPEKVYITSQEVSATPEIPFSFFSFTFLPAPNVRRSQFPSLTRLTALGFGLCRSRTGAQTQETPSYSAKESLPRRHAHPLPIVGPPESQSLTCLDDEGFPPIVIGLGRNEGWRDVFSLLFPARPAIFPLSPPLVGRSD